MDSAMSGPGGLTKLGAGRLELVGNNANTFGGIVRVNAGELWLNKTNVLAVPSHLVIGTVTNGAAVRLFRAAQIASTTYVGADHVSSLFDLQGFSQTVASIAGNPSVNIGPGTLTIGGDGIGAGYIGGAISGSGALTKTGTGTLTLAGNNAAFGGVATVSGGTLVVNGMMANAAINVASGAKLAGSGSVGFVNGNGMVSPGNSPGKLTTKHFTNANSATLMIELNGTLAGATFDQVDVTGTVKLGGTLQVTHSSNTPPNTQFTIIKNDSSDAVIGSFNGLSQGAQFTAGGVKLQISYTGGDGNDVVLTQIGTATNAQMRGVSKIIGSTMQISGLGSPGFDYTVQASTNLSAANWVTIGTATAGGNGSLTFNDFNAMDNFPMRYYRFIIP
jgi:autotransporter-associated beta strand protein